MRSFLILFCAISLAIAAPTENEIESDDQILDKNNIEVVKSSEHRFSDFFTFQYSLSDGQERQETINFDDLEDTGITVEGSYTLQLADGGTQTIYYISDINGHRIKIDKPFTEEEVAKKPKTTAKPIVRQPKKLEMIVERKKAEEEVIEDHTEKLFIDFDVEKLAAVERRLSVSNEGKRRRIN